jgi:ApaG protein
VGHTPVLRPGSGFQYESYCPLPTEWGTMEGSYRMKREHGAAFNVRIGRFVLSRSPDR